MWAASAQGLERVDHLAQGCWSDTRPQLLQSEVSLDKILNPKNLSVWDILFKRSI